MEMGFRFLKMDVGIDLLGDRSDCVIAPPGMIDSQTVMHPFTGLQITDRGIDLLCEYVAAVREEIGYEVPLAADHFGHLGLESCIRLGRALDRFSLAWYEDMLPWQLTDQYRRLAEAVETPICTGEDIYLKEGFADLFRERAIAVAHPDLATAGGHPGDQEDRRRRPGPRHRDGDAHGHDAGGGAGVRALRGRHGELPRTREPLGRRPGALEQPGRWGCPSP